MKQHVLEALEKASGYISGQRISRAVGKSRTAVWQWIEELRSDGYEIEAATRRGYRLVSRPDRLYPWEVARYLDTRFVGKEIRYHERIGSTNDEAKQAAKNGAPDGTVVVAEEQVSGRGRRGRSWASPFGLGIWSSTILRPDVSPYDAPKAALLSALAVVRAVSEVVGIDSDIKWPNDVLVEGKKVAGILVEMDAELEVVRSLVLGIGINANLPLDAIPEEARSTATSLKAVTGDRVDRVRLLGRLLTHLEQLYVEWKRSGFGPVLRQVREKTVTLGRDVLVLESGRHWEAKAVDLAEDGSLLVTDDSGRLRPVYAAEVSIREKLTGGIAPARR